MGKVRIKSFGDEEQEQKEQEKKKEKRERKKLSEAKSAFGRLAQNPSEDIESEQKLIVQDSAKKTSSKEKPSGKKKTRSKTYLQSASLVERKNKYKVADALDLIEKLKRAKFDETLELHINTTRTGQFGNVTLPHGTGKKVRVAIANDDLIAQIETGRIDFDILLATPEMMPKLAKVARVLGPRGLMPNPKNATVVKNPETAAKEFEKGQMAVKTEGKFPVIHLAVGKVSFGKEKLNENVQAVLETVKAANIKNATLKSTMSPGVKIQVA